MAEKILVTRSSLPPLEEYVDEIAAMLILQGYLDRLSSGQPLPEVDPDYTEEPWIEKEEE